MRRERSASADRRHEANKEGGAPQGKNKAEELIAAHRPKAFSKQDARLVE
jgi:hypothetical protein